MPKTVITEQMEKFIRKNYLNISGMEIAEKFGVSKSAVYRFMKLNGLEVPRELLHKWRAEKMKRPITATEIEYIHQYIKTNSIKTIAKELKRTAQLISETAKELGYAELIIQRAEESRLKKGHIPANKGKTMDAETREKVKHTWFKKGHLPANTLEDGAITIRHDHPERPGGKPYKYIRLSLAEWKPLHRHLWEEANGPIPFGMNVVFKDGDTLNCDLDNLEMIDNAENMLRNTIHNYPEELKMNIRLTKKLERKIRDNEQHNGTK